MRCPACGNDAPNDARTCPACRARLDPWDAALAPDAPGAARDSAAGLFLRRAAAFLVGELILFGGVLLAITFWAKVTGGWEFLDRMPEPAALQVVGAFISWNWWTLWESSRHQATPGKMALGLKVADLDGRGLTFPRATARFFGKFLSGFCFGLGFLLSLFTRRRQALHDLLARTVVERVPEPTPAARPGAPPPGSEP